MKLYYSPGACSLSPHIVAQEIGIPLQLEKVDLNAKRAEHDGDYWRINPKGTVPCLVLDNGDVLTEGPVIGQYLADLRPEGGMAPANGSIARYRLQEMLGYINSELHKIYSPLFNPAMPTAQREERAAQLRMRYVLLEQRLTSHDWLVGDHFSVADAYLFAVTNWAQPLGVDLSGFSAVRAFQRRVASRPAVQAAMLAEGLLDAV